MKRKAPVKKESTDLVSKEWKTRRTSNKAIGTKRNVRRGRPKRPTVGGGGTLAEKLETALNREPHNAVYVSTTKGGMKILFDGHHFKYIFRRGACSIFQCCYKENMEQCMARVIISQNRVYPLDGEHNHFNQAMDKSVTSVMFEATPDDFNHGILDKKFDKVTECDEFAENVIEISESIGGFDVILPVKNIPGIKDIEVTPILDENINIEEPKKDEKTTSIAADDFREKIKKRLQKALLGKKK